MTHTPGPWKLAANRKDITDDCGLLVGAATFRSNEEEQPANARLIAAAPELLEALRDLCALGSTGKRPHSSAADGVQKAWRKYENARDLIFTIEALEMSDV